MNTLMEKIQNEMKEKSKKLETEPVELVLDLTGEEIEEFRTLSLDDHWSWEVLNNNRLYIIYVKKIKIKNEFKKTEIFRVFSKDGLEGSLNIESVGLMVVNENRSNTIIKGALKIKHMREKKGIFKVIPLNGGISLRLQDGKLLDITKNKKLLDYIYVHSNGNLGNLLVKHTSYTYA